MHATVAKIRFRRVMPVRSVQDIWTSSNNREAGRASVEVLLNHPGTTLNHNMYIYIYFFGIKK